MNNASLDNSQSNAMLSSDSQQRWTQLVSQTYFPLTLNYGHPKGLEGRGQ